MDNKKRAAELIMTFLPIVGQDPYTGITTAKECAKAAAEIAKQDVDLADITDGHPDRWDYEEIIKLIDTF